MKHSLFFSLALLLSLCSCNSQICTINGIAENPIFTSDGKYMVLLDREENTIDSCYVEDGKFVLSCKRTDKFQYAVIVKDPKNGLDLASFIPVIPDISQLDIDFDQHRILTSSSRMESLQLQDLRLRQITVSRQKQLVTWKIRDTYVCLQTISQRRLILKKANIRL